MIVFNAFLLLHLFFIKVTTVCLDKIIQFPSACNITASLRGERLYEENICLQASVITKPIVSDFKQKAALQFKKAQHNLLL